jgi:hypothetical protein
MTLSTGTKLAHYEITSQIGKWEMEEVYHAKVMQSLRYR